MLRKKKRNTRLLKVRRCLFEEGDARRETKRIEYKRDCRKTDNCNLHAERGNLKKYIIDTLDISGKK